MKKAYILMSRVPIARRTKTRLLTNLEGSECAELHRMFLKDLFKMARSLDQDIDVFLSYTPRSEFYRMEDLVFQGLNCFPQEGDNIGFRMANAIKHCLDLGYEKVVLTGTDIPAIQTGDIEEAFRLLDHKDLVMAATVDGGYYLVGMKDYKAYLFEEDYDWGERSVFEATVDRIRDQGHSLGLVSQRLDLDLREDLVYFLEEVKKLDEDFVLPKNTIAYLEDLRKLGRF